MIDGSEPRHEAESMAHGRSGAILARKIALLLRYGVDKPAELEICPEGYYSLNELYEFWAVPHSLSFEAMMTILRENQYKRDVPRWELDPPAAPSRIRVVEKERKGGKGKGSKRGAGSRARWNDGKDRNAGNGRREAAEARTPTREQNVPHDACRKNDVMKRPQNEWNGEGDAAWSGYGKGENSNIAQEGGKEQHGNQPSWHGNGWDGNQWAANDGGQQTVTPAATSCRAEDLTVVESAGKWWADGDCEAFSEIQWGDHQLSAPSSHSTAYPSVQHASVNDAQWTGVGNDYQVFIPQLHEDQAPYPIISADIGAGSTKRANDDDWKLPASKQPRLNVVTTPAASNEWVDNSDALAAQSNNFGPNMLWG
eukprot:GEMP01037700.1.p1 GENE.GEMP01037700.1~~GEMP01037700.1.p1  ORF type:complete len:368 (+),score=87.71 GEMP01037700.1:110-1213(+)